MTGNLVIDDLTVDLGSRRLVSLSATVRAGEVLSIMGPSGTGKSTLLSALIGTLEPAFRLSGRIHLAEREVTGLPPQDRRIGILFQHDTLFPHLSVAGNLAFAVPAALRGKANRRARIDAALASAGLAGFGDRDPATLSGGQRARVALLRTLLAEPAALLLDEPFSRLDTDLRAQIRSFVFDRARSLGLPVLLVTHDVEDARHAGGPVLSPLGAPVQIT